MAVAESLMLKGSAVAMSAADSDRWATARGESITIEGVGVAYWRTTDEHSSTVIMLHGLGGDHVGLAGLAGRLNAEVIAPDLPGYGSSQPLPGQHSLTGYADVVEQLRSRLGLARFTLLGHSLGGSIALVYASRYGAALDSSLCLLNPVIDAATPAAWLGKFYYDVCGRLPRGLGRVLLTSRPVVYLSDRLLFASDDWETRRRILQRDYVTARLSALRAVQEVYLSLAHAPFDRYATEIQAPTLLVTGDRDQLCTPRSLFRLQRRMPRATVEIVPNAGHLLPVERPDAAAKPINGFLLHGATVTGR
ncbi:MAG: alpha/beta fold hydrolase [Betaproteobacteria bacterium]